MNRREAILRTADLIEARPEVFRFVRCKVPECGSPGCLIGLIQCFMGHQPGRMISGYDALGVHDADFYCRMNDLSQPSWSVNPSLAAYALRRYADAYFPAKGIPESVRELFEVETV